MDPKKKDQVQNQVDPNTDQNTDADLNQDVDLQKSLDDQLASMNGLIKSKKASYTEDEVQEMMKDKKVQEYMKKNGYEKKDDHDDESEEGMKKSIVDDIYDEHSEVIDAIPVLKSFSKVLESLSGQVQKIGGAIEDLQKSIDEEQNLQKSFGGVISAQSALIKSISEEIETLGNEPNQVKGKVNQKDLFKSTLHDSGDQESKIMKASVKQVKSVLLKSFSDGENWVSTNAVAKWEQSGYNLSAFTPEQIEKIESKL
jgi:hypothetical protein